MNVLFACTCILLPGFSAKGYDGETPSIKCDEYKKTLFINVEIMDRQCNKTGIHLIF